MERDVQKTFIVNRRGISSSSQGYRSSDSRIRREAKDFLRSNRPSQGQGNWGSSSDDGKDVSPRGQEYRPPDLQTVGRAEDLLHGGRSTRQPSPVDRRDGSPRIQGHRPLDQRPTGMTQSLHLNERSTHSQGTANFELESIVAPSQFTRRPRNRRPPKDEEKGEEVLNSDEPVNRLSVDQEMQSSLRPSLSLWNSHLKGRKDVTVTVTDAKGKDANQSWRRWTHIEGEGISFQEFKARVMQIPGLDNVDHELISDLVDEIQISSEREFVHDDREFKGHPVRALLQSRYRLEPTYRRDKLQVLTHYATEDRVVTVPQIWALVINNYTVITCAPVRLTKLLGKTILTKPYTNLSADSNTRSLSFSAMQGNPFDFTDLHFMDPQGKVSCVPLVLCRTWFGLVKCVVEDCIGDEFDPIKENIKYELLNGGPSFQLIQEDGSTVTMDSWSQILKDKAGTIHLRLADHQGKFKRLMVTHHNEEALESDVASDVFSEIRNDSGDHAAGLPIDSFSDRASDTTVSSTASVTAEGKSSNLANKLYGLRAKLQRAKEQVDWEKVLALSSEIPILENRILEWTAETLLSELREKGDVFEEAEATLPASLYQRRKPGTAYSETSSLSSTNEGLPESESSSRSRSSSRSTSPSEGREQLPPEAGKPSMRTPEQLDYTLRPSKSDVNRRDISPARQIHYGDSFRPLRSRAVTREFSHTYSVPSHFRAPLQPLSFQQSRWDTIRLRVLNGQSFSRVQNRPLNSQSRGNAVRPGVSGSQSGNRRGSQGLSFYGANDRRELALGEQSAPTSKPKASSSYNQNLSYDCHDNIEDTSSHDTLPNQSGKLPAAVAEWLRLPKTAQAPPAPSIMPHNSALRTEKNATSKKLQKEGNSQPQQNDTRPALRRLVDFAHKAAALFPNLNVEENPTGPSTSFSEQGTERLPIFLWSIEQKPSMVVDAPLNLPRTKTVESERTPEMTSARLDSKLQEAVDRSRMNRQAFESLLADMHNNLLKPCDPGKQSRKHALLYERTVGRSAAEAESLVRPKGRDNSESMIENANLAFPTTQKKGGRMYGGDSGQNVIAVGSSAHAANSSNLVTEHLAESHALRLKSDVFVLAGKMLHAFVPEGYDAPIISKCWGAVHKLLRQDLVPLANLPVTQIVASKLSKLHERVRDIQNGMRTIDASRPTLDHLPKSLIAAFQRLLMLFVVATNMAELQMIYDADPHPDFVPRHLLEAICKDCNKRLVQAKIEVAGLIRSDDCDGSAGSLAIDSEALLSLILANFAFHSSESGVFNLTKTYRDYTTKLRSLVRNRAYVRVHNHIPLLIEELEAIKTILKQQRRTLHAFRENVDIDTTLDISHLSLTVLNNLLKNIDQRIRNFEELLIEAESAHAQSRSLKSESNNKAILVFTVTTIIFLPLSFVTSYLGMNTSDLRNTQAGQTLFWAIGAPVAFSVFGIALLAAYYGEVTHRATRLYRRRKDKFE